MSYAKELARLRNEVNRLEETGEDPVRLKSFTRKTYALERKVNRVNRRRARVGYLADEILGWRTLATLRTAIVIDRGYHPDSWK